MWIPSAFLWLLLPGSSMVELPGMGNQHPFSLWALVPNFARVFNTQTQPGWTPGRQIPQFVSKIDQGANASLEKEQGACPHWFLVMQTFQEWTRFQSSGHKMMMIIDDLEARKKEDTRRCWEICSVSAFQDKFYILLVSYHSFTSLELWSSIQQPLALGPWPFALPQELLVSTLQMTLTLQKPLAWGRIGTNRTQSESDQLRKDFQRIGWLIFDAKDITRSSHLNKYCLT